jgi:hypothetical protein
MGGSYSASSSASAANKITTGPTTFGGVSFGTQNAAGSNTMLYVVLAAVGYFLLKGRM